MGQTLTNGIYLPNEGERNCYSGLAANWNAVDTLKGNYSLHAINVDIHVTAAEKETWNSKADNSALTAHTSDTTIHVTSADKQAWNGKADASALTAHTGDTTIHVTAADKAKWDAVTSKADDSDVVHKSGNETLSGTKTFEGQLKINAYSWVIQYKTQGTSNYPNYNTFKQIEYNKYNNIITLRRSSDVLNSGDNFNVVDTSFAFYKIHVKSKYVDLVDNTRFLNDGTNNYVVPLTDNATFFGSSSNKWKDVQTYQINSLEPSSLSLPSDISARIDISSYFTNTGTGQSNNYTVPANGYIYLTLSELTNIHCFSRTSGNVTNYAQTFTKVSNSIGALYVLFPVRKNDVFVATWYTSTTVSVDGAYFIPCQGNV